MDDKAGRPGNTTGGAPPSSSVDSLLREVARAPNARAMPTPGEVVGSKYRIERLIGKGGMGAVFAAQHEVLRQRVALKVMLAEAANAEEAATRFLNEARAAAQIEGEHVARVFDVGQLADGSPFIAMEFLEGSDLSSVLAARGSLPIEEAVDYVLQALEAVAQAHALGIVHRDLKPANLFLAQRRDGTQVIKVLDFGISKAIDPLSGMTPKTLTRSSSLLGSPLYMAPEQLRSAKTADARVDLWAIGIILFESLAGRPPFDGETIAEVFVSILERPATSLRALRSDVPAALEAVVMRCLAKEPSQRFGSVGDLAGALVPFAPLHARPSADRIVRLVGRGGTPVYAPALVKTTPLPSAESPEKKAVSASPWSSNTHGFTPKRRRVRALMVASSLAISAAIVAFGVYRATHREVATVEGPVAMVDPPCMPGSVRCDDAVPQTCSDSRQWAKGSVTAGQCGAECTPGSSQPRCSGKTPQTCGPAGHWLDGSACPYACSAGACAGVCAAGATQCAGVSAMQTCDPNGQWAKATACKSNVCREGTCTAMSVPGPVPPKPPPPPPDCEPNYYLDAHGEKRFKPECFGVAPSSPKHGPSP